MQTVNHSCGHCGHLITVKAELPGQAIACPHCHQEVVLPEPGAAAGTVQEPYELPFTLRPVSDLESIFNSEEYPSDDVFGAAPKPLLEMPPEPPVPPQLKWHAADQPTFATDDRLASAAFFQDAATGPGGHGEVDPASGCCGFPARDAEAGASAWPLPGAVPRSQRRRALGGGLWMILVIIPLMSYSILATLALAILYQRRAPPHPLEMVPDIKGEYPGATRRQKGELLVPMPRPDTELPSHLRVPLGRAIRVGDLEALPETVELRRVAVRYYQTPEKAPVLSEGEALVLYLKLRNISRDVVFRPTDRSFDRRWVKKPGETDADMPYTFLEMVSSRRRFYGGAVSWQPRPARDELRDYVEGQDHDRELRPGEEMTTLVCTSPEDRVAEALGPYQGELLWRVQLRRGLVRVGSRDVSATAVIGVVFSRQEIRRPVL
jgi:hypothetical protein